MLTPASCALAAARGAVEVERRLRHVLAVHLDPRGGSRYWLERQTALGADLRDAVRTLDDLRRVPSMTPADLSGRPLADFVPRSRYAGRAQWTIAQTGGATGNPVWTAYSTTEFHAAFVEPFVAAARHVGFPGDGVWLYAGPSGPHVIGRAASCLARALGGHEPFSVDFDPRWARKLPEGSFGRQRYVEHVLEQALAVIRTEPIDVLFTTPPLLAALAPRMSPAERERLRGVHYGGTHLGAAQLRELQQRWFPAAVHLSGYGNTLFGCCLELDAAPGRTPTYFPHGDRLVFSTVDDPQCPDARRPIRFSRLDETVLLINMVERDMAELVRPADGAPAGFSLPGVRDVGPIPGRAAPGGLY